MNHKYVLNGYELHSESLAKAWLARHAQHAARLTTLTDRDLTSCEVESSHPHYAHAERDALYLMRFELVATSGEAPDLLHIYRDTLLKAGYPSDLLDRFPITSHDEYKRRHYRGHAMPSPETWLTAYEIREKEKTGRKFVSSFMKALVHMFPEESLTKLLEINEILAEQVQPVGYSIETDENTGSPVPMYDFDAVNQITRAYLDSMQAKTEPPASTGM